MPNQEGHYGPYGASFAECVEKVGSWSDNPEGFCNWIHQQSSGGSPGSEERKAGDSAGAKFMCADCGELAPVEWGESGATYGSHGDCMSKGQPLAQLKQDTIVHRKGKWVLLSKKTGAVLGTHETEGEALAQERAIQASKHSDSASRVNRIDFYAAADLSPPESTVEGYLRVDGRISRVGIQVYHDAVGGEHRELRLPEEVFDDESLRSFSLVPLTNTHPDSLLTDVTAKSHAVGAVGEQIRRDGDFLRAPLIIYDREAVNAARAGRSQLSCGYSCELDHTPGVWNGQRYDAVQRKIRGNHVALVDIARAGPEARIRLDSAKSAMLACEPDRHTRENKKMPQIRIDGTSIEVAEANVPAIQQLLDQAIAKVRKDATDAGTRLANVRKNLTSIKLRKDAMKAKMVGCDACDGTGRMMDEDTGEEMACDYCDGKGEFRLHEAVGQHGFAKEAGPGDIDNDDDEYDDELDANELEVEQETESQSKEAHKDSVRRDAHVRRQQAFRKRVDSMVDRRLNRRAVLLEIAKRALGSDWKVDGKSSIDIKRAVVAKLDPAAKADKLDARILEGEFRSAVRKLDAAPSAADVARAGTAPQGAPPTPARLDAQTARSNMMKANQDAWKRPAAK